MKKVVTAIMAIILPCMATLAANSANSGILKGRILDNEKKPLPGAVIVLDDNQQSIIADADGFYSFANLPSGKHNLEVSYIGYVPVSRSVSVVESPVTADIVMADTSTELNEVVVTGVFSGQHKAINAQKNNLNITNIVSADQIGKFRVSGFFRLVSDDVGA